MRRIEPRILGYPTPNLVNMPITIHENAPAHRTLAIQKKLAYLGFQCLDHPPYSPDLAPSDYHLFSGLKK